MMRDMSCIAVGSIIHNLKEKENMEVLRVYLKLETIAVLNTHRTVSGTGPEYCQWMCVVSNSALYLTCHYYVDLYSGLSQRVEVLYVDYGNQEFVCLSSLRPLDCRFAYLPCQAIKCSLKVKPFIELSSPELKGSGIPQWPKHTKKWFKSLLMGQHAVALFLTANSSNHAQVDIAISREMFLPSLSFLRGVLSITEGIQQFLQSTHFFALFGVSSFMCAVKLAVFSGDKWSTNVFCAPSVFTFPAPIFMHPFSGLSPQHSLFPIVKYCSPPSLVSPGFIQPLASPTSSISDEATPPNESRCHSEKPMTTQTSVLKKRKASLSGLESNEFPNLPVDLQSCAGCGAKVSRLSSPQLNDKSSANCGASSDVALEALPVVVSTTPNNSLSTSVVDVTGLECNSSLSTSAALSHSSNSSTPNSQASNSLSNSVVMTTVTALAQSSPLSSVSTANSHCEVVNLPQASSPVAIASKSPECNNKAKDDITQSFSSPLSATLSVSASDSHCEIVNSPQAISPVAVASKSPECNKNIPAVDDCIKFYTIAALPILSTVISNDSDHYSVIVSHIVSPSEFYLNFALDTEEVKNFDSFQQSFHDYYSARNEAEDDLSENLSVGVLCSARYKDGTWNRGIIRDTRCTNNDEKKTKYLIQYIDYGNYQWVPIDNIRSLQEEFLSQPALTVCCSLSGVIPARAKKWQQRKRTHLSSTMLMAPAGSEDDDMQALDQDDKDLFVHGDQNVFESAKESKDCSIREWSLEATERFMHLSDGKVLVAVINEEGKNLIINICCVSCYSLCVTSVYI